MSKWERHGEAQRVRDPLAQELQDRGWRVRREYPFPDGSRCDIYAERWDERRMIECKLKNPMPGITQVLGYVHRHFQPVTPTLAIPRNERTDLLVGICRLAGVELWVEGSEWNLSLDVREARGESEIRKRFDNLAAIVTRDPGVMDMRLEERAFSKWEELVTAFHAICGREPAPRLRRGNDGSLLTEFPPAWHRLVT